MGIQINGATDSITAIDGTIDVVSAIGNAGVVTATAFVGNITGNVTGNINHASNLELQVGGVTRANIDSTGKVGINQSSPDYELDVTGRIGFTQQIRGASGSQGTPAYAFDGDHDTGMFRNGVNNLCFGTAGVQRLTIDENGKLGLGVNASNPSYQLQIHESDSTAYAANATVAQLAIGNVNSSSATNAAGIHLFTDGNGRGVVNLCALNNSTNASADFVIQTRHSATIAERLRITSSGKTIISSPSAVAQTPVAILDVFNQGTTTQALRVYRNDLNDNTLAAFQSYHNALGIVDKMVITSRGRVGINTNNPQREIHVKPWDNNPATAAPGYIRIDSQGSDQAAILELYHTRGNGSDKWPSSVASVDGGLTLNVATGNNGSPQERLRIDSSGNIKLSSDVLQTLAVKNYGYSGSYKSIMVGNPNSNSGTVALCVDVSAISGSNFHAQNQVITGYRGFLTPNAAGNNFIGVFARDASADKIYFGPSISSGLTNGPITATTSKVGINETNPQAFLDIGGNTDGDVTASFTRASDPNFRIQFRNESSSNNVGESQGKFGLFYASNSADICGMQFLRGGSTGAGSLTFTTGGTERLRINSTEINAKVPITGAVPAPNRNIIENGEFLVSQRMGDAASTKASSGANIQNGIENGIVDRWRMGSPSASNFSRQRVTDAPSGFAYSFKVTNDGTQYNPGNANYSLFQQIIEAPNVARLAFGTSSAKTVTLSFYVKSSYASSTWAVALGSLTGGVYTNATRTYIKSYSISSANTWERKTITFPGDTSGTWPKTGTGGGLAVVWDLGSGGNHQGTSQNTWASSADFRFSGAKNVGDSANGSWQITGIQLEIGDTATEYEHIPIQKEIERCQRYFYCSGLLGSGSWNSPTTFHCAVHHPVAMRGRVTVGDTRSGGLGNINIEPRDQYDISVFDPDAHTHYSPDQVNSNQVMNFSITGSTTTGYSGTVSMDRNNDQFWLSAEL